MHPTHDPRQPRPLPTGWKNWLILTAFVVAGFPFGIPTYFVLILPTGGAALFVKAIWDWAWYIGLALSLITVAIVVIRYRKRRCGTYALAFTLGVSAYFAYGSIFTALGYL